MDPKQCEKCGETVDAAKAFCPGCGSPMVAEETRTHVSEFDASAGTVQYGKTVFGRLLSDMGLNIADAGNSAPNPTPELRTESIQAAPEKTVEKKPAGLSRTTKWIMAGVLVLVLGAAALLAVISLFVYLRWEQL